MIPYYYANSPLPLHLVIIFPLKTVKTILCLYSAWYELILNTDVEEFSRSIVLQTPQNRQHIADKPLDNWLK